MLDSIPTYTTKISIAHYAVYPTTMDKIHILHAVLDVTYYGTAYSFVRDGNGPIYAECHGCGPMLLAPLWLHNP